MLRAGGYAACPIVHSDRESHYTWPVRIERMDQAGLIRSESKKGCCPDNAACEGFFRCLRNDVFFGHCWQSVSQ